MQVTALVAAAAIVIVTPLILHNDIYLSLPLPLRFYIAPQPPALFAILPHAAYLLIGFAAAPALVRASESHRGWLKMLAAGLLLLTAAGVLAMLLADVPPFDRFWGPTPQQFLYRIGGLLAATSLVLLLIRSSSPRATAWLEFAGRKSLAIYVLHLMLIYGSAMNMGIRYWLHGALNNSLAPVATATATIAIIGITWYAVRFWEWLRTVHPGVALWSKRLWWGVFWGFFLLKP
jgi:hypothetical protein